MVRRQQLADRALRPAMRSPGRPIPARHVEREFRCLIARGKSTGAAAIGIGVSVPVGARWCRHAGGMPPLSLSDPTGRYLSFHECEELALLRTQELGYAPALVSSTEILGRSRGAAPLSGPRRRGRG